MYHCVTQCVRVTLCGFVRTVARVCVCVCVPQHVCVRPVSVYASKLRATPCLKARRTSGMIMAAVWLCQPREASGVQELLLQMSAQIELFVHVTSSAIVRMRSHPFKLQRG